MGKATFINQHDWLAVRASFGAVKANVTWNRAGLDVKLDPMDSKRAELLSLIVEQAKAKFRDEATGFYRLDKLAETMKSIAEASLTLDEYLSGMQRSFGVTGERPRPKGADNAPATTQTSIRKSRSWEVTAFFPTGERFMMKLGKSSVSLSLDPSIASKYDEISRFVLGAKQVSGLSEEEFAEAVKVAADDTADLDSWFDAFKESVSPSGPRMG